eukprot:3941841-Rhodomonas_salina.3
MRVRRHRSPGDGTGRTEVGGIQRKRLWSDQVENQWPGAGGLVCTAGRRDVSHLRLESKVWTLPNSERDSSRERECEVTVSNRCSKRRSEKGRGCA